MSNEEHDGKGNGKVISLEEKRQQAKSSAMRSPTMPRGGKLKKKVEDPNKKPKPGRSTFLFFVQIVALAFILVLILRSCGR